MNDMLGFTQAKPSSHANDLVDSQFAEDGYPLSTLGQSSLHQSVVYDGLSDNPVPDENEQTTYEGEEEEDAEETLLTPHPKHSPSTRNIFTAPVERILRALVDWSKGPQPPRLYSIKAIFEGLQIAPVLYLHRCTSKRFRLWLLMFLCVLWALTFLAT